MVLTGTIVNGLAIIIASCIGILVRNIPEKTKETVMHVLGLAIVVLGIGMSLESEQYLIVIGSLVIGAIVGEQIDIEKRLNAFGRWIERKVGPSQNGSIATAFVTTSLIYVVGAMAILGALDSGLRGDHSILFTKSMLDGFTAIIFTSTLGIGVLFSAFPVVIYQGLIALFATQINEYIPPALMDIFIVEMTATGGVMLIAIGLNIVGLTKIRIGNLLPGLAAVAVISSIVYLF